MKLGVASQIARNRALPIMANCDYEFAILPFVRRYHMYKDVWQTTIGEILPYQRELNNRHSPFTVGLADYCGCNCTLEELYG